MPTQPAPSWSKLKSRLSALNKDALLSLLRDLYALNADNKVFLSTRFLTTTPEELAAPYRRIVRLVFNPDRGMPSLQLGAARKALNDFKKACADPLQVIDFMLFYVEQGVICTNSYGDINAPFYESLLSTYRSAAELNSKLADSALIEQFRPRFAKIVWDTGSIGWGFHDGLEEIYWDLLPAADEAI
jgi:hypothetical protein